MEFTKALPVYTEIQRLFEGQGYKSLPERCYVVVADVRGSTRAIETGQYRDVNFIGAACITSMQNKLGSKIPFCFGGDGAALIIEEGQKALAEKILSSLIFWSEKCFGLELHAAIISIKSLKALGKDVRIAHYKSKSGPVQAMFTGGGISLAEDLMKNDRSLQVAKAAVPHFDQSEIFMGLTCRWRPVPANNGKVVSIVVDPVEDDGDIIAELFGKLLQTFGGDLESARPIDMRRARYQSFWANLKRQNKVSGFRFNRASLTELLELLLTIPLFGFKCFRYSEYIDNYVQKIPQHCDFQKLDDQLRMVLDCTTEQRHDIESLLNHYEQQGSIRFGLHISDAAQMTCYVESLADEGHFHFVDGSDGGYAMAAKRLKRI